MPDWKTMIRGEDRARLIEQAAAQMPVKGTSREIKHTWAVRLYLPLTPVQWIITELDEVDEIAFGLAQIAVAELGSIWMPEVADLDLHGLRVRQDMRFNGGNKTLGQWMDVARASPGGMLPIVE